MNQIKYLLRSMITIPLLPLLYFQSKKIRASVPKLPEAKGNQGFYEAADATQSPLKLITLGESTIAGVGVDTHQEGFSGTLAAELSGVLNRSVAWKVYAKSGYTAKRVLHELIPKITEASADLIVVGLGANDAFKLSAPANWRRDINRLILALRSKFPDALIVFCNMPPIKNFPAFTPLAKFIVGGLVELLGKELDQLVQEHERVFYNSEIITFEGWIKKFNLNAPPSAFFSDGVHPSKLTYQIWAKDVASSVFQRMQVS